MSFTRRAVIDIGTNSVKLLVADVAGREVKPVWEDGRQTRLGEGFYETHRLRPDTIRKTADVVASFAAEARRLNAESLRVIATSAARDAKNPDDLTGAVHRASGLLVEIISGAQEADLAFRGVASHPELANHPIILLDVGGGSTEFILGHGHHKHFAHSFPLGTVRLLEKLPHSDPPKTTELAACRLWLKKFLHREVTPHIARELNEEAKYDPFHSTVLLVGTGGTTTILARIQGQMDDYDRERIEATRFSLTQVKAHVQRLWGMSLEQRRQITGLPPQRADVILNGVVIYEAVMEEFGFNELRISTRGLRFAAVMADA